MKIDFLKDLKIHSEAQRLRESPIILKKIYGGKEVERVSFELTPEKRRFFSDLDNLIFKAVDIGQGPLMIYGSYVNPVEALFAADIDLAKEMDFEDFDSFIKQLRKLINTISKSKIMGINNIQIANEMYTETQFKKLSDSQIKEVLKAQDKIKHKKTYFDTKFIKVSAWFFNGSYVKDFSIAFNFDDVDQFDTKKAVKENIDKFIKQGNYFRALKRLKLLPNYKIVDKYLLDPKLSMIYALTNKLETLIGSKIPNEYFKTGLDNIKNDLRKIGVLNKHFLNVFDNPTKSNIEVLIEFLKKIINKAAKNFFNKYYY